MGKQFQNNLTVLWYDIASHHRTSIVPEFGICVMKSPWLTVCVIAAVAFLRMTEANSDEPDKAPTPAVDPMRGTEPGEVRGDNGLGNKRCQEPLGCYFGRPRRRVVDSSSRLVIVRSFHDWVP